MQVGQLDYPRLDKQIAFNFKDELKEILKTYKFNYVSQFITHLYYEKNLSCEQIAFILLRHKYTINRWMALWGMKRRNTRGMGRVWSYGRFCVDCGVDTVAGYRSVGRCWPCYMAWMRERSKTSN